MMRAIPVIVMFSLAAAPILAQTSVGGEWAVTLTIPNGERRFTMLLVQKGERLSGDMVSDMGQFELRGVIRGDQIKFEWSLPSGGKLITLTFTGKVAGNSMSGLTTVGDFGEALTTAQRTGGGDS